MKRKTKLLTIKHVLRSFRKPRKSARPRYRFAGGRVPPHYIFRIRRFHPVDRIAWFFIRRMLNRDRYTVRVMHSGPRLRGSASTRKENSIAFRVYVETKPAIKRRERFDGEQSHIEWQRRREAMQRRADAGVSRIGA